MDNCMFLKGKLKYLILKTLEKESYHAYAIRKKISELSNGAFTPSFGSLYPALEDLLEKKYISLKIKKEKKEYLITESGKKHLLNLKEDYKKIEKEILKTMSKTKIFELDPKEMSQLFIAQHKLTAKILKEYDLELYKFLNNYNKNKLTRTDLQKYLKKQKEVFELIKDINKKYSDNNA